MSCGLDIGGVQVYQRAATVLHAEDLLNRERP